MHKRAVSSVFVAALLAVAAVLFLAPGHDASPQLQVICKCSASITLQPDPGCGCGLSVMNLMTRKGRCTFGTGGCANPSTLTCEATGTVSETGCSGFMDVPFEIESSCTPPGLSTPWMALCMNMSGTEHIIWLDCSPCRQ